jgi:hypothetical protein
MVFVNKCEVFSNCSVNYDCWCCDNYQLYRPINPKIFSPRQIENRAKRKEIKKEKKETNAFKRGKANKRTGKQSEQGLCKKLIAYGFDAEVMPLSGALGGKYRNDLHVVIGSEDYTIENKRRMNLAKLYKLVSNSNVVFIKDFCFIMSEEIFIDLINCKSLTNYVEIEDKSFKYLHGWFEQDKADIVTCQERYKNYIFCIKPEILRKMEVTWEKK